ncbi:HTH_Tnp_Tc3_2 domain-containing protein [Trichonephila clavipes]|nr:HTH_Tnp_Tc3_2 domain-containing protein [Trichonephila clavipes]
MPLDGVELRSTWSIKQVIRACLSVLNLLQRKHGGRHAMTTNEIQYKKLSEGFVTNGQKRCHLRADQAQDRPAVEKTPQHMTRSRTSIYLIDRCPDTCRTFTTDLCVFPNHCKPGLPFSHWSLSPLVWCPLNAEDRRRNHVGHFSIGMMKGRPKNLTKFSGATANEVKAYCAHLGILGAEVHEQMLRSGVQHEAKPLVYSSQELGNAQSVISKLWQRFQDDGIVSRCYSKGHPRVTTQNEDQFLAVTAKRNRRSTASDLSRQLSLATGTTVTR